MKTKILYLWLATIGFYSYSASAASLVHILDNLNTHDAEVAHKILMQKGYQLSNQPLFQESKNTIVITKANGNEFENPSIQVEVVHLGKNEKIPTQIYQLKLETKNLGEILNQLPSPAQLKQNMNAANALMSASLQSL